jgi:hypothetical protein
MAGTRKKKVEEVIPLMASAGEIRASTTQTATRTRRNKASGIIRTDRFKNIDEGLVPYKYSKGVSNKSNVDVRDTVILCQKAYYNFSAFRNVIDLMTEFSTGDVYFTGGNKKSRDFFEAFYKKINISALQDRYFREYFRSGNVFLYRFDANLTNEDALKVSQVYGTKKFTKNVKLPAKYIILNPADIQLGGTASFHAGTYYKVMSDYELERLRNPRTDEDIQILNNLDEKTRKLIKQKRTSSVLVQLDKEKINAVFYKKQDYEPFAVPMGFPVLEDINWKAELKKMDMAISRTMQQAILVVTMGAEPDKGGVNQKNLQAMQSLFENESVGRVLIADYTTRAEFVVPNISALLDPKKYEVVDRDIQLGLNNILVGESKFANQNAKVDLFVSRLAQGRKIFLSEFLIPEIKRIAKEVGFKSYPTPHFNKISLKDNTNLLRIYGRLIEVGVLTAEEGIQAIETGRLPEAEESIDSQKKFKKHRGGGLYEPLMGGPETQKELADKQHDGQMELQKENIKSQEKMGREKAKEAAKNPPNLPGGAKPPGKPAGRPAGSPQDQSNKSPIGDGEKSRYASFSLAQVTENMAVANKLFKSVEAGLREEHKIKRLSKKQKQIAEDITCLIIANEEVKDWDKNIKKYIKKPMDHNHDRIKEIREIAGEHQIDDYLASILYASKK